MVFLRAVLVVLCAEVASCRIVSLAFVIVLASASVVYGQVASSQDSIVPVTNSLCDDMKLHHVMAPGAPVGCDRLRVIKFSYVDFDHQLQTDGEIMVMDAVATHVLQIFSSLREIQFPIKKARLLNHYEGDDDASMSDNNTSAFNDRKIAGKSGISLHAYGLAIDLNPIQNPTAERADAIFTFRPAAGAENANRLDDRPGKSRRLGMAEQVIDVFADNGFVIWGGYWDRPMDYQHFQIFDQTFADRLVGLSSAEASAAFTRFVESYRRCRMYRDRVTCIVTTNPAGGHS